MSGIYIPGMEMPTKEYGAMTITLFPDGKVVEYVGDIGRMLPNAIPVPDHGRLVDADEAERLLIKMQQAQKDIVARGVKKSRAVLRDLTTIIPADKEGE